MKITLKQGELVGKEEKSIPSGKIYHSYLGIPYAEPPVNLLRFQAPIPHQGWNGVVLKATKTAAACLQKTAYVSPSPFGDEDCLFVNVHVPQSQDRRLKPVMVFVHGGGFLTGSGDFYEPSYLMEYDVIVVTFNYRLHVFGFLNLNLPECSGNMGLKDQALLFKWVRENIAAFGGDSNNVTAVGESAGAASIHYLIISPLGKGLFDRAIIQSGSAFCPWAFTSKHLERAFELGKILGCETKNTRELYNFLLEVSSEDLSKAARKLTAKVLQRNIAELAFVPSVETEGRGSFLPARPQVLAKDAHPVSLMIGVNDLESLIFITEVPSEAILNIHINENICLEELKSTNNTLLVSKKVETFYFRDGKTLAAIINLLTDVQFAYPFDKTCMSMLKSHPHIPVYAYKFSYEGSLNLHKKFVAAQYADINLKGTSHSDELAYLFMLRSMRKILPYHEELKMIRSMCTLWSNFVKFGAPSRPNDSVQWDNTTLKKPCYLHINDEIRMKNGRVNQDRMLFWDKITDDDNDNESPSRSASQSKL